MRRFILASAFIILAGCGVKEEAVSAPSPSSLPLPLQAPAAEVTAELTAEGIIRTAYFDLTVDSAVLSDSYEGIPAAEGKQFLLTDITVHNTCGRDVMLYDSDFQVFWGESEDEWCPCVTVSDPKRPWPGVLPGQYTVQKGNTVSGRLLFEIGRDIGDIGMSYYETAGEGREGEVSVVFFKGVEK